MRVLLRQGTCPTMSFTRSRLMATGPSRGWFVTMTTFVGISPAPTASSIGPGHAPPSGSAVGPPGGPPAAPSGPSPGVSSTLVVDLTEASRLAARAVEMISILPAGDTGSETTKDLRLRIYSTNMAAQSRLERQFDVSGNDSSVLSALRQADAYLEDSNWQLALKPSPDGRFTGVDVPGALRDASEGARIIADLLRAAGGNPTLPAGPHPPVDPAGPPPVDHDGPPPVDPVPPTGSGATDPPPGPDLPPSGPDLPPPGPDGPLPPGMIPPGGAEPDPDYPDEDEFPTDEKILGGGGR
jgi:hypothetical protein